MLVFLAYAVFAILVVAAALCVLAVPAALQVAGTRFLAPRAWRVVSRTVKAESAYRGGRVVERVTDTLMARTMGTAFGCICLGQLALPGLIYVFCATESLVEALRWGHLERAAAEEIACWNLSVLAGSAALGSVWLAGFKILLNRPRHREFSRKVASWAINVAALSTLGMAWLLAYVGSPLHCTDAVLISTACASPVLLFVAGRVCSRLDVGRPERALDESLVPRAS